MKEKNPTLLGIDAGTSKVAAVLTNAERHVLAHASRSHNADLRVPKGRAEQDPSAILEAVRSVVRELPADLRREVRAVGVTGQMHGAVVLDAEGKALTPLVTWQDQRCGEEAGFLEELQNQTGYKLHTGFGCATLAWMGRHEEMPREAASASTIHDLVVARLCGLSRPVADPTDAAGWGLFDLQTGSWDVAAVQKAGIPEALLPAVVPCGSEAGRLERAEAESLGIPGGIPVAAALGDNQASLLATLREPDKELALTLGTGGQVSAVARPDEELPSTGDDSTYEYRPYPGGRLVVVAASLCGGAAWKWLAGSVRSWARDLGASEPPSLEAVYEKINELGLSSSKEIAVSPHFLGERHDPSLRGSIEGLDLNPLELGALARGLARGIMVNFREMLPSSVLDGRTRIVGSGNALRRTPLLREMAEEVFGLPLDLVEGIEEAAAGAALNAAAVIAGSACLCSDTLFPGR